MKIQDALQVSLIDLEKGASLEKTLARFPEFMSELRPMLEIAVYARELARFPRDEGAQHRSRTRMLAHAVRLRKRRPKGWLAVFPRFAMAAFTALFVALVGAGGLITASAQSLPGDALYGMKRSVEEVRLALTSEPGSKRSLSAEFNQRRIDETLALMDLGRREVVTFEGVVSDISVDSWVVGGIRMILEPGVDFNRPIEVGMGIQVTGEVQPEGWLYASSVRLRSYAFIGIAQQIHDSYWVIDGQRVVVDELTEIDVGIEVLDRVRAEVQIENSGEITARTILAVDGSPAIDEIHPTPTPSPGDGELVAIEGVVTSIRDQVWTIDDNRLEVSSETVIEGSIKVGDRVRVSARQGPDGRLMAVRIILVLADVPGDTEPTNTSPPVDASTTPGDEPPPTSDATQVDQGGDDLPPTEMPPDTSPTDQPPTD